MYDSYEACDDMQDYSYGAPCSMPQSYQQMPSKTTPTFS